MIQKPRVIFCFICSDIPYEFEASTRREYSQKTTERVVNSKRGAEKQNDFSGGTVIITHSNSSHFTDCTTKNLVSNEAKKKLGMSTVICSEQKLKSC